MLRAIRLSAKLGLTIAPKTRAPIKKLAPLLSNVPPSRLFDEMLKLLLSGNAVASLTALRGEGLHHGMLPLLDIILEQPMGQRFTELALADTDARVREGKHVSPSFLFACLLWHEVLLAWETRKQKGERLARQRIRVGAPIAVFLVFAAGRSAVDLSHFPHHSRFAGNVTAFGFDTQLRFDNPGETPR